MQTFFEFKKNNRFLNIITHLPNEISIPQRSVLSANAVPAALCCRAASQGFLWDFLGINNLVCLGIWMLSLRDVGPLRS